MKSIMIEPRLERVGYFRTILESHGIATFLRNENISIVETPIFPFWPELCVVNDDDYDRAVAILKECIGKDAEGAQSEKNCPKCHESNPGNFDICWSCQEPLAEAS